MMRLALLIKITQPCTMAILLTLGLIIIRPPSKVVLMRALYWIYLPIRLQNSLPCTMRFMVSV